MKQDVFGYKHFVTIDNSLHLTAKIFSIKTIIMNTVTLKPEIQKLQQILKYVFVIVPIAAGADKFLNLLTDWTTYIHPAIADMLPISAATFMMVVGVIEIAAGILVLKLTRLGAYVVALWLILIALSLLFTWHHPDVAVRDIVMAVAAFTLAKLTEAGEKHV